MYSWKLNGVKKLVRTEEPLPEHTEGKLRVRVTKVLLNGEDAAMYAGTVRPAYPIVPGRYAVGVVAEDNPDPSFPKGTRVLLHTYRLAETDGVEKRDFSADDFLVCGRTVDGFLSDFVLLSPDEMTPLPASVNDKRALILHQVAAAKAACDSLGAQKGQHIAVVGADLFGILVCQLLIYQQAAPILIGSRETDLEAARKCGIYYTLLDDGNLLDAVASITGGRLTNGAVYIAGASEVSADRTFSFCGRDANVVLCSTGAGVTVDLQTAFRKHLTLYCVTHGADYIKAAINLMANNAVDPTTFRANLVKPEGIETLLTDLLSKEYDIDEISVVDLV